MKSWKKLFVTCLAAIQLITMVPVMVAAEGDGSAASGTEAAVDTQQQGDVTGEQPDVDGSADNPDEANPDEANSDAAAPDTATPDPTASTAGKDELILMANSNVMYHNGVKYTSPQPITVKKGVSYIALRSLVDRFGLQTRFDNKTKETIITNGDKELRYKAGSDQYRVNGSPTKMSGESYIVQNTFMVPVTSAMQAFGYPYTWDSKNKRIVIQLNTQPVAKFSVNEEEIFATQTRVTVKNESTSPTGLKIVDEQWEGLQEYYDAPGVYTITLRVVDERGNISEPFSVNITVQPAKEPPKASFQTPKTTYKMGEYIRYEDMSTDKEDSITERVWTNNEPAFFQPGPQTITLKVTNKFGLTDEYSQTIMISDETLYSFHEFNLLYTGYGEVFPLGGQSVLSMKLLQPEVKEENRTLYRTNSPETVLEEGIVYKDRVAGGARIFLHHKNGTDKKMQLYVLAKNVSERAATVYVEHYGQAGPNPYPQQTGKLASVRYMESFEQEGEINELVLQPNETRVLIPELNERPMRPDDIYTMYADFFGDNTLEYSVVALDASKDIMKELNKLKELKPDGKHIRGTFNKADRVFTIGERVGEEASRLVFADKTNDTYIEGSDMMTYENQVNAGNYGVLYRVKLENVAPHTLIAFNSRGGSYSGGLFVNGQTLQTPNQGRLSSTSEASVVYRTGAYQETVEILFTPAAGSNMPVNLLFIPLPKEKPAE
ncbi:stalk domain-containing protein [Paenibacillus thiaminolyticus]|uniref:stalk domain-containing protein n=1 Tax=Paenibacillus thiaminolyticus TaxID=49283 RepID=UPI0023500628|nr:stalk domain-containing protein [Paenibacillus thiaminolyticus]WCR27722.1 stalk domain-containing protein [Paenibacillus thiaminolyticus]